jgi:hypothetical protein
MTSAELNDGHTRPEDVLESIDSTDIPFRKFESFDDIKGEPEDLMHHALVQYSTITQRSWFKVLERVSQARKQIEDDTASLEKIDKRIADLESNEADAQALEDQAKQRFKELISNLRDSARAGGTGINGLGDTASLMIWQLDKSRSLTESLRKRFANQIESFVNRFTKQKLQLFDMLDAIVELNIDPTGDLITFRTALRDSKVPVLEDIARREAEVVALASLAKSSDDIIAKLSLRKLPALRTAIRDALKASDIETVDEQQTARELSKKLNTSLRNAKLIGRIRQLKKVQNDKRKTVANRIKKEQESIKIGDKLADEYFELQKNNWIKHGGSIQGNVYTGRLLFLPPTATATRDDVLNSVKKFDFINASDVDWRETKRLQDAWLDHNNGENREKHPFLYSQVRAQNERVTRMAFNDQYYKVKTFAPWMYASLSKQAQRIGMPTSLQMVRMINQMQGFIDANVNDVQKAGEDSNKAREKLIQAIDGMSINEFIKLIDSPSKKFMEQPSATLKQAFNSLTIGNPQLSKILSGKFDLFESYMNAEIKTFKLLKDIAEEMGLHVTDNRIYVPDYTIDAREVAGDMVDSAQRKGVQDISGSEMKLVRIKGKDVVLVPIERSHFDLGTNTFQIKGDFKYLKRMRLAMGLDWGRKMGQEVERYDNGEQADFNPLFDKQTTELFLLPLIRMTKQTAFAGSTQADAMAAWESSNKTFKGFLDTLWNRLKDGKELDGMTEKEWMLDAMSTMTDYYSQFMSDLENGEKTQDYSAGIQGNQREGMDARKRTNYPSEWTQYKIGGKSQNLAWLGHMAFHAAMGKDGENFLKAAEQTKTRLDEMNVLLEDALARTQGQTKKEIKKALRDALGSDEAVFVAENASKFKGQVDGIVSDLSNLFSSELGPFQDLGKLTEASTFMILGTLSGPRAALTQFNDLFLTAGRTGASVESAKFIGGRVYETVKGMIGSLFGALGVETWQNDKGRRLARDILGIEYEAGTSMVEQLEGLVADMGFEDALRAGDEERVKAARSGIEKFLQSKGFGKDKIRKAMRIINGSFTKGFSRVDRDKALFEVFNPWSPFSFVVKQLNRSVVIAGAKRFNDLAYEAKKYLERAAARNDTDVFIDGDPKKGLRDDFKFSNVKKELGYGATIEIKGVELFNQQGIAFDYYTTEVLERRVGTTLEQVAYDNLINKEGRHPDPVTGKPLPYTLEQYRMITSVLAGDITGDANQLTTRTAKSGFAEKLGLPLLGWPINRAQDFAKQFKDKDHQMSYQSVANGVVLTGTALLPTVLAFSLFRDWFDEVVMGKKSSLKPLSPDTWFVNTVERFTREGTMGIGGEAVNLLVNTTAGGGDIRTLSFDQRIFLASSFRNIVTTIGNLGHQDGAITYSSAVRPLLQNLGGNGALQFMQMTGTHLGWDNPEVRHNARANMINWLRAGGYRYQMEPTTFTGSVTPAAYTPYVTDMMQAAFINDVARFNKARRKAIQATMKAKNQTAQEAADTVARSFNRRHPLKTAWRTAPTSQEVNKVINNLPERGAQDVREGLQLFNKFNTLLGNQPYVGKPTKGTSTRTPINFSVL